MANPKHVDLNLIENYLKTNKYPPTFKGDKGKKANLRRAAKKFSIIGDNLMYNENRLVIKSSDERLRIIKEVHEGLGDNEKARAMASHRGRDTNYEKIKQFSS